MYFLYNGKFGGCELTPTVIKKETKSFNLASFNEWHISLNWGKFGHLVKEAFPSLKITVHQYGLVFNLGDNEYFITSSDSGIDWLSNDSEFLNYAFLSFVKEANWEKDGYIKNKQPILLPTPTTPMLDVKSIKESSEPIKKEKKEIVFTSEMSGMYKLLETYCNDSSFYFNDYMRKQLTDLLKESLSKKYSKSLSHNFVETFYNIILAKAPKCTSTVVGMDYYLFGAFDTSFCMYQTGLNFVNDTCKYKVRVKNWTEWSVFVKTVMPNYIKFLSSVQAKSKKFGGYDTINAFGKTTLEKKAELNKIVPDLDADSISDLDASLLDGKLTAVKYKKELDLEASKLQAQHNLLMNKKKELEDPEFKKVVKVNYADFHSEMYKWYRARVELLVDSLRGIDGITNIDINYSNTSTSIYIYVTGKYGKKVKLSIRDHGHLQNKNMFVILVRGFNLTGVYEEILELCNKELGTDAKKEYIENKKTVFFKYLKVRKLISNKNKTKDSTISNDVVDDTFDIDVMDGAC